MRTNPPDKPQEYIEGWIGYLYENIEFATGYAQTVGELDAILWHLHHVWSGFAGQGGDWCRIRSDIYIMRMGKRINTVRNESITNADARKLVLKMWKKIDRKLGIEPRADQYDQFIKPSQNSQD